MYTHYTSRIGLKENVWQGHEVKLDTPLRHIASEKECT